MLILGFKGLRKTPSGHGKEVALQSVFSPTRATLFKTTVRVGPCLSSIIFITFYDLLTNVTLTAQKVSVFDRDEEFTFKIATIL